jgi:hypothetical protein
MCVVVVATATTADTAATAPHMCAARLPPLASLGQNRQAGQAWHQ